MGNEENVEKRRCCVLINYRWHWNCLDGSRLMMVFKLGSWRVVP